MKPTTYMMNNTLVIALEGEFDAQRVSGWREDFEGFSKVNSDVLVDMSEVYFVDSSGVGALVFLYKRLLANGYKMSVLNVHGQPKTLFDLLHLGRSLRCYASVKEFLIDQSSNAAGEQVA